MMASFVRRIFQRALRFPGGFLRHIVAKSMLTKSSITFETCDVFGAAPFTGNPLAVVFGAERLTTVELQKIAAEFGYSETTFVMPPADPTANTARVRIFTPTSELPFAGHPNVGTAVVLARRGEIFDKSVRGEVRFEEIAGVVPLEILFDGDRAIGAMLTSPESFRILLPPPPLPEVARAIGLSEADIVTSNHVPLVATVGLQFLLVELSDLDALARSRSHPAAFASLVSVMHPEQVPTQGGRILAYVRTTGAAATLIPGIVATCRNILLLGSRCRGSCTAACR